MAELDHNILTNEDCHYTMDQWVYVEADSSRPPVYNAANCSSADLGGYADGMTQVPQPAASPPQGYRYENTAAPYYQPPQSYASSTASVPCPEGVEREDPNLRVTNTYLPLGPDMGLNEVQHRRSASVHSDMSFQMRRFLIDQKNNQPRLSVSPPVETNFLPQDIYIQSPASKKAKKDKKRSKPSYQSFESSSSEDYGFMGYGADLTVHMGKWTENERYEYPLSMSGLTDELNGK